ncbi:MAG: hypothetical protein M1134_04195 [Actinobacteria bacterium]|jgi:hypothetical protein|nr:hypothetical protein [Actinomycetota bacterium]
MPYPPVIERVIESLHSFAPGGVRREAIEVSDLGGRRRVVRMNCEGGWEIRVSGDSVRSRQQGPEVCVVQLVKEGTVAAEAGGIPSRGTGRVAKAMYDSLREQTLKVTSGQVIAAFDSKLRTHRGDGLDALRVVAEDEQGEIWLEVVDHAKLLGYDLDGSESLGRRMLWTAFEEYRSQAREMLEVSVLE